MADGGRAPARGTGVTGRAARACARHPWRTITTWVLALVVAVLAAGALLGDGLTADETLSNRPDSVVAKELLDERLGEGELGSEVVVVRAARPVGDPAVRAAVARLARDLRRSGGAEEVRVDPRAPGPGRVSADGRALLVPVQLAEPPEDAVEPVISVVEAADGRDGLAVAITGEFTLSHDFDLIAERDLREGEFRIGFPAALIVLVLVFGALVAAALPIVLALVSIAVALGLTAVLSQGFPLSFFVVNMVVAMGLALGIDYALFVVSRVREERAAGRDRVEAIAIAGSTASRAVLFSGSAFVLAMLGLLLVPSTVMRSLAAGAILVGIVTVAAALTLLPALLALLGDRIDALRVPWVGRRLERSRHREGRFWVRVVRGVTAHPAVSLACAVAVLLAAASPLVTMDIGAAEVGTLPGDSVTKRGLIALERSFPQASAEPAEVVVDGPVGDPAVRTAFTRLEASLAADPRFGPAELVELPGRDLSIMRVQMGGDPLSDEAIAAVRELRDRLVPAAFAGSEADALVGGPTALNLDYFDVMRRWLPLVISFVLGLSVILLTVAFRSVVVAASSIVMNLLSVGAAYGLLVLVFQHGVGTDLLGFQQVDTIEAWVPLFLFAVLFGLSMDYQVFLLSRIRERHTQTGDTRAAVVFGIGSTARIITGAALIIVAVFIGFAAGDLVMFQQMGFGVAVALLIDATIVRSVLVPATMALLGGWNWYLPGWLGWLPHVEVEGSGDRRAARAPSSSVPTS
ncbi:MMPL family transporter [Miltoncostaea marina]|uniref:MMPL family transporter n=1 Tax=Miltoncostaea marina TaxID=2843215 RepID=UPI001C3D2CF0|nr:MMPL family transporter [Miltoncostaea marina]